MTAREALPEAEPRITLDDVKHRAEEIRDLAVSDVKTAVAHVTELDIAKKALIIAGVVIVAASFAYFLGARAARGRVDDFS